MSFVDFMIIGAMKSGTTTLSNILSAHPEICFSQKKEPHFFSKTESWQQDIDSYKALYTPIANQLCGEASTTYTCYPEFNKTTWKSLYEFNSQLKLIYIMRHPIDRIVSHYMHNYLRGYTDRSFEDDVLINPTYLNRTRYFVQIKPYLEYFGTDQVFLLTFEEFLANKQAVLQKMAQFLGIDFSKFDDFDEVHRNRSVGETKRNVNIEKLRDSKWVQSVQPLIPAPVRTAISSTLHQSTARTLDRKPEVSALLNNILWDLLLLDILEIEKLMQRELTEWNIPRSPMFSQNG